MPYKDIQHFMKYLEKKNQLKRIKTEVSPVLEITEIADRVVKKRGPALLFEKVKGSPYPLLINTFGSYRRMSMAIGADKFQDIGKDIEDLIDLSNYRTMLDKIKSIPRLARLLTVFPIKVKNAPCQEVIEEPDLNKLPVLKCWPKDGGRFITMPLVFTKDPETGQQNIGMYRLQVYDKTTTGMHWHLHKDGREIYEKYKKRGGKMPVSVVIGCDPATIYAATAPLPKMIDEIMFAGYLRRMPVPVVKSVTNDIYVPANSEFVLEGYVDTNELRMEGPFGDHTGYYSEKDLYPVFHITKMTRKEKPVFMATVVGKPPMEDCFLGKATERLFLPLIKMIAPEIVDINFPLEGVFHNCVIVSIQKKYPAHAKKILNTLWGNGQLMYTKMIIVVDADVDPHDISTVAWKVFNNIDAKRDLIIQEGPLDALDHASPMHLLGYRLGIDATRKWASEGYEREWPDEIVMSEEVKKKVDQRWKQYGIE
ncbi:MAG: 3-octaprenyl-4-hydroxybenzoate carboxy-lyase [Lachnoclostridium sp.]|jgi:4-hydroxy-3-polyprenylbenzoate decarboxylase